MGRVAFPGTAPTTALSPEFSWLLLTVNFMRIGGSEAFLVRDCEAMGSEKRNSVTLKIYTNSLLNHHG
jgi:hypothetical protein